MSIVVATTRVASNVAPGNQDITTADLGLLVPGAAAFYITRAISDGVAANHAIFGMGAATGPSEQWAFSVSDEDGQGITDLQRRGATDECVLQIGTAGVVDGEANLVSFIPGGVRINWGNAPAAAYLLTVVFFAGPGLTARAGVLTMAAAQDAAVNVTTDFEPDVLLLGCFGYLFNDTAVVGTLPSLGVAVNKTPAQQYCWAMGGANGVAPSQQFARISDNYGCGQVNTAGAWTWAAEFGSYIPTGFTCTTREGGSGGDQVGYLALAFAGTADFWAGIVDTPPAPGLYSVTWPGFEPQFVMQGVTQMPAIDTGYTNANAGSVGLSVFDEDDEYCNSVQIQDNVGVTNTQSLSDDLAVRLPDDDGTAAHVASFDSFIPAGWTLDWTATEATAVQCWALAISRDPPPTPTVRPARAVTHFQSRMLPLLVFEPLVTGAALLDDSLGFRVEQLSPVWTAFGGYWSLSLQLTDRQNRVEEWIDDGLGRHVELYDDTLCPIWEGYVSEVSANIGSLSLRRGPLLDTVANRVCCVYSTIDTSVDPPAMGSRDVTAWYEDADSQARYGVIEHTLSISGATAAGAAQVAQTALAEMKEPLTQERDNMSSSSEPSVTIACRGYVDWLKAYAPSLTTTGDQNVDAKLRAILAADPNGIFSTDYSGIDANATQVSAYEQKQRTAMSLVKGLVALGDAGFDRWLFGFYHDRRAVYEAISTNVTYQRSLSDPEQRLETYGSGQRVLPWNALPGKWVFYTDLFIGKAQATDPRADPRYLFVEQNTFALPWALTLEGTQLGRLDQLLGQMGLSGTGG